MRVPILCLAAAVLAPAPVMAQQPVVFPCEVTTACSIRGNRVECSTAVAEAWEGRWEFAWDGQGFAVTSPRGSFPASLQSEVDEWPITLTAVVTRGAPPALLVLYEEGALSGSAPGAEPGVVAMHGVCEAPR